MQWWPNKLIMVRPEIRFDHCFKQNGLESTSGPDYTGDGVHPQVKYGAFDNGTRDNQVTFAVNLTYHF